jgi:hypothetical protein
VRRSFRDSASKVLSIARFYKRTVQTVKEFVKKSRKSQVPSVDEGKHFPVENVINYCFYSPNLINPRIVDETLWEKTCAASLTFIFFIFSGYTC